MRETARGLSPQSKTNEENGIKPKEIDLILRRLKIAQELAKGR